PRRRARSAGGAQSFGPRPPGGRGCAGPLRPRRRGGRAGEAWPGPLRLEGPRAGARGRPSGRTWPGVAGAEFRRSEPFRAGGGGHPVGGPDPHDAALPRLRRPRRPVRLRLAGGRRVYAHHGLRTGRLHRAGGRTHRRTMAGRLLSADEALSAWLEHLAHERRLSPRTLEAYGHIGRLYLGFLARHRGGALRLSDLGAVSAAEVRAHLAERRAGDRPLSARSISQTLSAIRTFHAFLDRRLDTPAPQLVLVRGPKVRASLPRPVSENQARGLLAETEADPDAEPWEAARDRAVLTLLYGCGLRISEALSLTRADAPLPETLRITGKGGKTRMAPVLPAVREAVDAYLALQPFPLTPDDALF